MYKKSTQYFKLEDYQFLLHWQISGRNLLRKESFVSSHSLEGYRPWAVDSVVSPVVRHIITKSTEKQRHSKSVSRLALVGRFCFLSHPVLRPLQWCPPHSEYTVAPRLLSNVPSVLNHLIDGCRSISSLGISQPIQIDNWPSLWGSETSGSQPELHSEIPSQNKVQSEEWQEMKSKV